MSIFLYGQTAERTHENDMLRNFIQTIALDWHSAEKDITLIANSIWNGAEIDLVCILPSALLMVDFKDYGGQLAGAENGPWYIDGIEVKGGSKQNPFHQLRDNKFSIMSWLNNANLLQGRDVSHTSAAVLFSGFTTGKPKLAASALRWFFTTDMAHCRNLLTDLSSPKLKIYGQDIQAILSTLGVQALKEDYGQANKGSSSSLALAPRTEVTQTSDSTQNPELTVPSGAVPTEKKSLSGMFKTAAAVGGIFLTLAVISQIYPSVGQSRTPSLAQNQYASTAEPITRQTAFATSSPNNESAQPITTLAAVNYIGQEVTACGRVSQTTAFNNGIYLNFDKPYPHHSMTAVIWEDQVGAVESKLGRLEELNGIEVCATGLMEQYKKHPQIKITDPLAIDFPSPSPAQSSKGYVNGSEERIEAYRAPFYVGKQVMACGVLAGTSKFAKGIYLSLDKKYPHQTLTLVLWDESVAPIEAKFGSLSTQIGRTFCALGTIEKYKKSLQIQVENPQFLRLMQ